MLDKVVVAVPNMEAWVAGPPLVVVAEGKLKLGAALVAAVVEKPGKLDPAVVAGLLPKLVLDNPLKRLVPAG